MDRRDFLAAGLAAGAGSLAVTGEAFAAAEGAKSMDKKPFRLNYAPQFGMFESHAGKDLVAQLEFMAGHGFRAMQDNGLLDRPREDQDKIARAMDRLGMTMGAFVAYADFGTPSFILKDPAVREMLIKKMQRAVEGAKRLNAQWILVVPGPFQPGGGMEAQTVNVIENLKWCAKEYEAAGKIMVIEPLNPRDHPGLFLTKIAQALKICKAVASPSCKIVNDIYHQQITEGDLIPNIDAAWDEIAYFHLGDTPGRNEPTTGEINYRNVFKHIHAKGYKGVLGMEHGKSRKGKAGEQAVIDAYRWCDDF